MPSPGDAADLSEQHLSHNQEQKPDKEQNEVLRHLPCPDHRDASLYSEQPKHTRAGNPKPPPDAATSTPRDQTAQAPHRDPQRDQPSPTEHNKEHIHKARG